MLFSAALRDWSLEGISDSASRGMIAKTLIER